MIRYSFFFLSLILFSFEVRSQIYVKALQWCPTGELGFLFDKSLGVEIGGKDDFDREHFRFRGSVDFLRQKPRMNAIPINAYYYSNGQMQFYPAVEVIKKYDIVQFNIGFDFTPIPKKKLKPYLGIDLSVSAIISNVESTGGPVQSHENASTGAFSIKGRFGLEYNINNTMSIFAEGQRQYGQIVETMWYSASDFGIGINYSFN
jgi:hypothetical protein